MYEPSRRIVATFSATIHVEYDATEGTAEQALADYVAENDLCATFELVGITELDDD
jgi:hypothetical protein